MPEKLHLFKKTVTLTILVKNCSLSVVLHRITPKVGIFTRKLFRLQYKNRGGDMKRSRAIFIFLNELGEKATVFCSKILFLSCILVIGNLTAKNELSDLFAVVQTAQELSYYFDSTLRLHIALAAFKQKNNTSIPEIMCTFCSKRSLPCDELLIKVQAKAIDVSIAQNNTGSYDIRKKMLSIYDEIINMLYTGTLDTIKIHMMCIAQENQIQCEDCQSIAWITLETQKKDTYANDMQRVQKNNNA